MNAPIRVAQLGSSGPGTTPPRVVKVTKPGDGQAVTIELSYTQSVKLDLSGVASEQITLVHVGERLIILFDNRATVTVEPFFDSMGVPLANINVQVTADRDITGFEFANLFPITTDQSVLPAAGDAAGPVSGANFHDAAVDPLLSPNPLPLLPQEELPGFTVTFNPGGPVEESQGGVPNAENSNPNVNDGFDVIDDEGQFPPPVGFIGNLGNGTASSGDAPGAPTQVFGFLNFSYGPDGPGDITLDPASLQVLGEGGATGLSAHVFNGIAWETLPVSVTASPDGHTITGTVTATDGPHTVFTLEITDLTTGAFTFKAFASFAHPLTDDPSTPTVEMSYEDNLQLLINFNVTDGNGDSAVATLTITIDDDSPVIECHDHTEEEQVVDVPQLLQTGGAIFVTGHDSDEHNNGAYQTAGLDYLVFGHAATGGEIAERTNVKIAYLAVNESDANELAGFGWTDVTVIADPADFGNAFTGGYDIIIVGSGDVQGDSEADAAHDALIALTSQFAAFINAGGGLYIHTDEEFGQEWFNFVPNFGTVIANSISDVGIFAPTADGAAIGLTEDIVDEDITHNYFTDIPAFFTVFEQTDQNDSDVPVGQPVAFGARGIRIEDGEFVGECTTVFNVDEADLDNFNPSFVPASETVEGSQGSNDADVAADGPPVQVSSSLSLLVSFGADQPGAYGFASAENLQSWIDGLGLESKGEAIDRVTLTAAVGGNILTASTSGANAHDVFAIELNSTTGDWTFTLLDQLDHPELDADPTTETSPALGIDLGGALAASDSDGDTVLLPEGHIIVSIADDRPKVVLIDNEVPAAFNLSVNEDDLDNFASGSLPVEGSQGTSPDLGADDNATDGSITNFDGSVSPVFSGTLASLVQPGADEQLIFSFTATAADDAANLGLTSKNQVLSYQVTSAVNGGGETVFTLTAFVDNGGGSGFDALTDRLVGTFELNSQTGEFNFKLFDQLDHAPPVSGSDENTVLQSTNSVDFPSGVASIPFGDIIQVTDFDGDGFVLHGQLNLTVTDDIPVNNEASLPTATVHEDALANFDPNHPVDGDNIEGSAGIGAGEGAKTTTAVFTAAQLATLVTTGADEQISIGLSQTIDDVDTGLDSKGLDVLYDVVSATQVNGVATDGRIVFSLIESPAGTFTFHLIDQVDHVPNNAASGDADVSTTIDLASAFIATDFDGDSVALDNGVSLAIENDVPDVTVSPATIEETPVTLAALTLDESIGPDPVDTNEDSDINGAVSTPTVDTTVVSAQAIGILSTPASAAGVSVAELFTVTSTPGADEPAATDKNFKLTLTDGSGLVVADGTTGVETTLIATGLDGTALDGTSDEHRTIWLFRVSDNEIVGRVGHDTVTTTDDFVALRITLSAGADPVLTVEQYLPIEHADAGSLDEAALLTLVDANASLGVTLTVTITDFDGDTDTDSKIALLATSQSSVISIEDDGPTITDGGAAVAHDESAGIQNDPQTNDVPVVLPTIDTMFDSDPDFASFVDPFGLAKSAAGQVAFSFGTDGPGSVSLTDASGNAFGGDSSGLFTTAGHSEIFLFTDSVTPTLVWGLTVNSLASATATNVAFAFYLDPSEGTLYLAQWQAIYHDGADTNQDGDGNNHDALAQLGANLVHLTVTDADGDKVTADTGLTIGFADDGPSVEVGQSTQVNPVSHLALELDETVQADGGAVPTFDRANAPEVHDSNGGADDVDPPGLPSQDYNQTPIVSTAPTAAQAIGSRATDTGELADLFLPVVPNYGADGPGNTTTALTLVLSANIIATTLVATDTGDPLLDGLSAAARTIYLHQVSDTVVEGRIAGTNEIAGSGPGEYVAFRITLTDTGNPATSFLTVDQFLAIDHDASEQQSPEVPSLFDENIVLTLAGGGTLGLKLTATVTDGDKDQDVQSATVNLANGETSFISFDDDGPSLSSETVQVVLDDEGQNTPVNPATDALGIAGGPGDDANALFTVEGDFDFAAGIDGLKSFEITSVLANGGALQAININPATGQGTPEAVNVLWTQNPGDAGGTYTGTGAVSGHQVFTLVVSATGHYTFTLFEPLAHPFHDPDSLNNGPELEWEDNLSLAFGVKVTDGDNDSVTTTLTVGVDDDTPDAAPQALSIDGDPSAAAVTANLNFAPGADGWGSVSLLGNAPPPNLTSGGNPVKYWVSSDGATLVGYIGADVPNGGAPPAGANQVFVLTVNPGIDTAPADDGVGGQYTFDIVKPIDGTTSQTLTIGGSSFGAGPEDYQILSTGSGGTGVHLSVASGWHTGGSFDLATWQATGVAAGVTHADINGSTGGWGVDNNNFTTGEFLRFDFGALTDFDVGGSYTPPATTLPEVTQASFEFPFYSASDDIAYVAFFSDGTREAATLADPTLGLTINAPAGETIDHVEFFAVGANGSGKVDLVTVGATTSGDELNLSFNLVLADGDGDAEQVALAVNVINPDSTPTVVATDGVVWENALGASAGDVGTSEGADDNPNNNSDPNETTTGTFTVDTGSDTLNQVLINGNVVTLGGMTVVSGLFGNLTVTDVGPVGGTFEWSYTLGNNTLTHPLVNVTGAGDQVFDNFQVVVTDTDGDSSATDGIQTSETITIGVNDDGPIAQDDFATAQEQGSVNLVLIIDVSGSMTDDPDGSGGFASRLDLAQAALENLLNTANVNEVLIVTFSTNAQSLGWFTNAQDAIDAINGLSANGFTNYDEALTDTIAAYQGDLPTGADKTFVLFLSDGEPNRPSGDEGIDAGEQATWEAFLTNPANNIDAAFAVGVGNGVNESNLQPIAFPNGDPGNPVVVHNETELSSVLTGLIAEATGNVISDGVIQDVFGADGGRLLSIEVDGTTYTWNGTSTVTPSGDPVPAGAVIGTNTITVPTDLGGVFTLNFSTGVWSYTGPDEVQAATPDEVFTYYIVDGDGDTDNATLNIDLISANDAPVISLNNLASFNVRDEFEAVAYSNNNGSANWAGNWTEEGDDNLANAGDVRIATDGDGALRFGNGDDAAIERVVNLFGATSATLTFDYRRENISGSDEDVRVFISSDGSDFDEVLEIDSGTPNTYQLFSLDISAYMSATTTVRIEVDGGLDGGEFGFIDNVDIAYTAPGVPTFTENSVTPVKIMPTATVADPDNPANFNGGFLTVALTAGSIAGDQLALTGGLATLAGSDVVVGGVDIGDVTAGGFGTTSVTITFDPDATDARVETLMQSIGFLTTSDNPGASRTATIHFDDGGNTGLGGPLSDTINVAINVVPVNDAPTTVADSVISNVGAGNNVVIPVAWLLANDTDPEGNALSVTNVGGGIGGTASGPSGGNVTFADTAPADGSFTYQASDGTPGGIATVTIDNNSTVTTTLTGGAGSQIIIAGITNDTITGGADNDFMSGGLGNDTYNFGLTDGTDVISDTSGADSILIDTNGAALTSLNFADSSTTNDAGNLIITYNGQQITVTNHYSGTDNVETISFDGGSIGGYALGSGNYTIGLDETNTMTGTAGNDVLAGDSGGDEIDGSSGDDLLFGNDGADTLTGGAGRDLLVGGAGADVYDFNATTESGNTIATADVIYGWDSSDIIDVATIDANSGTGGNQSFTFGGNDSTVDPHEIAWFESGGNTIVHVDTNGVAGAEMMFVLTGINLGLTAANFNP
jgi:T1SS-143 domain-containing protein